MGIAQKTVVVVASAKKYTRDYVNYELDASSEMDDKYKIQYTKYKNWMCVFYERGLSFLALLKGVAMIRPGCLVDNI